MNFSPNRHYVLRLSNSNQLAILKLIAVSRRLCKQFTSFNSLWKKKPIFYSWRRNVDLWDLFYEWKLAKNCKLYLRKPFKKYKRQKGFPECQEFWYFTFDYASLKRNLHWKPAHTSALKMGKYRNISIVVYGLPLWY